MLLPSVVLKVLTHQGGRGLDMQEAPVGTGGAVCSGLLHGGEVMGFLQRLGVAEQ